MTDCQSIVCFLCGSGPVYGVSVSTNRLSLSLLTYDDVCDDEGEYEDGEEGEGEDEHVEETVVPSSHAVPHPRTVMVKALCKGGRGEQREGERETENNINCISIESSAALCSSLPMR